MGWKNWNVDVTLLCYRGEWFHTTDDMDQGRSILSYFDVIIEVTDNEFTVIKDRYYGNTGKNHPTADLFRVQLFALGKTFYDLPEFRKSASITGYTVLGYNDNGELFEYSEPTRTM